MSPTNPVGEVIKSRRKALRITQADLAWVAKISRNTVANAEHPKRNPEPRTVQDILTALGMNWRTLLERIELDIDPPSPMIPESVARRFVELIIEIRERDENRGRSIADRYLLFVDKCGIGEAFIFSSNESSMPGAFSTVLDQTLAERLAARSAFIRDLAPYVDPNFAANDPIFEFLGHEKGDEFSWGYALSFAQADAPGDAEEASSNSEGSTDAQSRELRQLLLDTNVLLRAMDKEKDAIEAFGRLPIFLQIALQDGQLVDHQITFSPTERVTMVSMVIKNSRGDGGHAQLYADALSPEEAAELRDTVHKWNTSILLARQWVESMPEGWSAARMWAEMSRFIEATRDDRLE